MNPMMYLDECVDVDVAVLLRSRNIDATTASEQQTKGMKDPDQLQFAASQGWSIVSHNGRDFRRLHAEFAAARREHAGIVNLGAQGLPASITATRVAIMLAAEGALFNRLVRWSDVQRHIERGERFAGFTERAHILAMGR